MGFEDIYEEVSNSDKSVFSSFDTFIATQFFYNIVKECVEDKEDIQLNFEEFSKVLTPFLDTLEQSLDFDSLYEKVMTYVADNIVNIGKHEHLKV